MRLFPEEHETIAGLGRRLRGGEVTCLQIFESCLDRIDEREADVRAWVVVDRPGAMDQARGLDAELREGRDRGPLHGIPIGIKDIIDVEGLPTRCGDPRDVRREAASADAPLVKRLRDAGAVILGKTVTTAYAWIDPPVTRNPWNLDHTPGGSSSGSAAAVACGMCVGAIGTQTGGSIVRPASFCGVAGMKPSFGRVSTAGILPFAPSLDHPGPIARCVDDLRLIFEVIREPDATWEHEPARQRPGGPAPPRLGRLGGYFDRRATEEACQAVERFLRRCKAHGAPVMGVKEVVDFEEILRSHRAVMATEAANVHGARLASLPEAYPPRIAELVREGMAVSPSAYQAERKRKSELACTATSMLKGLHALITPATIGPAPDPSTTGDPALNSPWSYLGFPTVSFPVGLSAGGLPVAVQLIGRPGDEMWILKMAGWCEAIARSAH
jgi:aspartyl-tRNA(Asn)/glutamyl-tRNA(Gln) amidotransferase subunit A